MRRIYALPVIALLAAAPFALAQQDNAPDLPAPDYQYTPPLADEAPGADAPDAGGSMAEGGDLIERGMGMFLDNLLNDMAPEIDGLSRDLGGALSMLGPVMTDLSTLVDDISNYQTPERLENGDIIIRRKADAPPPPPIGESLRGFGRGTPEGAPAPERRQLPVDPYQPQVEL
ncbi:hypothetical protein [uncultured Paracoccus sp.]|uniref:hypothetical protein n=1 Tax=uncultured Paracoccus sp. TaxID=189685 RepID=UPI00262BEA87|nr:hypothetical protein [uncultured Paracoccus sp.]